MFLPYPTLFRSSLRIEVFHPQSVRHLDVFALALKAPRVARSEHLARRWLFALPDDAELAVTHIQRAAPEGQHLLDHRRPIAGLRSEDGRVGKEGRAGVGA